MIYISKSELNPRKRNSVHFQESLPKYATFKNMRRADFNYLREIYDLGVTSE